MRVVRGEKAVASRCMKVLRASETSHPFWNSPSKYYQPTFRKLAYIN